MYNLERWDCDSEIEDMDWTCGCKYCQVKENVLSCNAYNKMCRISKRKELDPPKKFEIQEECLCECCEDIKYCRKYGQCRDINFESKFTCICEVCAKIRKDSYLFYAENLKPEPGCLCKVCRNLRTENEP